MSGWDLKKGVIKEYCLSEDQIWSKFNFVFSDSSRKRNTYKFGLIKSLLDNAFNGCQTNQGVYLSFEQIFSRFAENYWNLVNKFELKQMRSDGRSEYSKIESILKSVITEDNLLQVIEFEAIDSVRKEKIIKSVIKECKKCVIGALYEDFDGTIYSFDLKGDGIYLNDCIYEFMVKHKMELEKLNYYSWAKFLERVNDDNALIKVIDKLELATPRRDNLSVYRELLRKEFEENTCFYCGKRLQKSIHVDHFIPWSFIKDDKLWNFVLTCPTCNIKKNNRVPTREYIIKIENRNKLRQMKHISIIDTEYKSYYDGLIERIWLYAKLSGLKEYRIDNK